MDESQKLAVEQFANIEIIKFMMLDLWGVYLLEQNDALARAATFRERHLQLLQQALDEMPDSVVRNALLDKAEENWQQIFRRLKAESRLAASQ